MKTLFDSDLTLEEAEALIKNGANVNEKRLSGVTPLFIAVNPKIVQLLIDHGANVNHERRGSFTPLMSSKNFDVMDVLVKNGADIHKRSIHGHSCIHLIRETKATEYLLNLGIDINIRTYGGHNMLCYASDKNAEFLIKKGICPSTINDYLSYKSFFKKEEQDAFDAFLLLTDDDNDFFQMCLAYQNDQKNKVDIYIKDMDIQ